MRRKVGTEAPGIAALDPGTGRKCEASSACWAADCYIVDQERRFKTGIKFRYLEGDEPDENPGSEESKCD